MWAFCSLALEYLTIIYYLLLSLSLSLSIPPGWGIGDGNNSLCVSVHCPAYSRRSGIVLCHTSHSNFTLFHSSFQVPPLGHIPRILARMKASSSDAIPKACVEVVHILADSEVSEDAQVVIICFAQIAIKWWDQLFFINVGISSGLCAYDVQVWHCSATDVCHEEEEGCHPHSSWHY